MTERRPPSLIDSFNYAIEGIIHVLRTQRNMRIHFIVAVGVIVFAVLENVTRIELVVLLIAIAFVLIAEMINSAIESAIDIATTKYDPIAKLAKDVAAGAVLIAAINAVAVGYLIFSKRIAGRSTTVLDSIRHQPAQLTIIALVVTIAVVIAAKAWTGRGTPLRGGVPSGHAAIAFAGWVAVTYLAASDHRFVISSLALALALLVSQTRVEAGVHTVPEVVLGGLIGVLTTLVVFQLAGG